MPINDVIAEILQGRNTRTTTFDKYVDDIEKIRDKIKIIDNITENGDPEAWSRVLNNNKDAKDSWSSLCEIKERLHKKLDELWGANGGLLFESYKRSKREYLNVGCIGPWRQGKSLNIAQLTGLDEWIIPRSQFGECTGTTINVFNGEEKVWNGNEYTPNGTNKAIISFYTIAEIVEAIGEYLTICGFIDNCTANNIDELRGECERLYKEYQYIAVDPAHMGYKKKLINYLKEVEDYADVLGNEQMEIDLNPDNKECDENKRSLRAYTSYYTLPDDEYMGNAVESYKVLAVKNVNIYTKFSVCGEEIGEIQFVDTPGIGEPRIGVKKALAKALREDLDIAIALKKVTIGIDNSKSFDFHRILNENTQGRDPEQWIYYLFNIMDNGENLIALTKAPIIKDLNDDHNVGLGNEVKGFLMPNNHIANIDILNDEEALQCFFYSILGSTVETILSTDQKFYKDTDNAYNELIGINNEFESAIYNTTKSLPRFDKQEEIDRLLVSVREAFLTENNEELNIDNPIGGSLNDEPVGFRLIECLKGRNAIAEIENQLRNYNSKTPLDKYKYLMELIKTAISTEIKRKITPYVEQGTTYNLVYMTIRRKLGESLFEQIKNRINIDGVIMNISNKKDVLLDIFKNEGRLNFITAEYNQKWITAFIDQLRDKVEYKNLYAFLCNYNNIEIDNADIVTNTIRTSIFNIINKRYDTYTINVENPGTDIESELAKVYSESLYQKENAVKDEENTHFTNEAKGLIENIISQSVTNNSVFITTLLNGGGIGDPNVCLEELRQFYGENYDVIFANDEMRPQREIVNRWRIETAPEYIPNEV